MLQSNDHLGYKASVVVDVAPDKSVLFDLVEATPFQSSAPYIFFSRIGLHDSRIKSRIDLRQDMFIMPAEQRFAEKE